MTLTRPQSSYGSSTKVSSLFPIPLNSDEVEARTCWFQAFVVSLWTTTSSSTVQTKVGEWLLCEYSMPHGMSKTCWVNRATAFQRPVQKDLEGHVLILEDFFVRGRGAVATRCAGLVVMSLSLEVLEALDVPVEEEIYFARRSVALFGDV